MRTTIGIFDSGVGGLTVAAALARLAPAQPIRYIADSARFPYGARSEDEVAERSLTLGRLLVDEGAALLIVACNTASSAALLRLREQLDVPVVGMEPPLKPAVERSKNGRVAVLVTETTARGDRLARLHEDHSNGAVVETVPMPGLADMVERGEIAGDRVEATLREGLAGPIERGADQIALGCTHYGFLRPVLRSLVGDAAEVVDAAEPVTRRARQQLAEHGIALPDAAGPEAVRCSSTGDPELLRATIERLASAGATLPPTTVFSEVVT
ncbi:MAG TPA: glutamate racemase [Dehalococcoidia bacterium]|jgi:glutamate racemase|nr:glutamate racemase [Dehalococcoidia bacterium]